jgi:spore maturation protein A
MHCHHGAPYPSSLFSSTAHAVLKIVIVEMLRCSRVRIMQGNQTNELMLNAIWVGLVLCSVLLSILNGTTTAVVTALTTAAQQAVTLAIALIGVMSLWLGLMKVAEAAGVLEALCRLTRPLLRPLFPDIPAHDPALAAVTLNLTANCLGMGNAATPFGLRAMEELQRLNDHPGVASNAMCTFLALNTSSVQLIPTGAIAILAASGARHPSWIIFPALCATLCSTIVAIISVKWCQRWRCFRIPSIPTNRELTDVNESP